MPGLASVSAETGALESSRRFTGKKAARAKLYESYTLPGSLRPRWAWNGTAFVSWRFRHSGCRRCLVESWSCSAFCYGSGRKIGIIMNKKVGPTIGTPQGQRGSQAHRNSNSKKKHNKAWDSGGKRCIFTNLVAVASPVSSSFPGSQGTQKNNLEKSRKRTTWDF